MLEYIVIGGVGTPLLGISDGEVYHSIESVITSQNNLLSSAQHLAFIVNNGSIDLTVVDNDDLWAIDTVGQVYGIYKRMRKESLFNSLVQGELDSEEAKAFRNKVQGFVNKQLLPATGINVEKLNDLFNSRFNFELYNTNSNIILNNRNILSMENILKNTSDDVKDFIKNLLKDNQEVYENKRIVSDNQRIFFYSSSTSIMPDYDDVRDVVINDLSEYRLKGMVPHFHKYVGPLVNFSVGSVGSTGSFVDGEYIKRAIAAEAMNDFNYKDIISTRRTELSVQKFGDRNVSVTKSVVEGNYEYDKDPITNNEIDYYNELCKWEDMCIERDMLEANIEDWVALGFNINEYIPDFQRTRRVVPFNRVSPTTFELVDNIADGFKISDLEKFGITIDTFKNLNSGSPTANKWFTYAVNVALVATRYYTNYVDTPIGYNNWEFNKNVIRDKYSFDDKYAGYVNGNLFIGNRVVSEDSMESNDKGDDSATFADYGDLYSEVGMKYWFGYDESEGESNPNDKNLARGAAKSLNNVVIEYILNSNVRHAFPEALIKCLRFGINKPESLQLDSIDSRVNLTTAELITKIDTSNPVLFDNGKPCIIRSFVVINDVNDSVKALLKSKTKFNDFGKAVIGVGVSTKYMQSDGRVIHVTEYYDIQTIVNDSALQDSIANLENGRIIESNPAIESIEDVIQTVETNKTTMSIQMNDVILDIISKYQDELPSECNAYKILNNINRSGYNLFNFGINLRTIKDLTASVKYISIGKVIDKLKTLNARGDVQNILDAEVLVRYGNILSKSMQIASTGNELFNKTFELWKNDINYSLDITKVAVDVNTVNVADDYRNKVIEKLNNLAKQKQLTNVKWDTLSLKMSKNDSGYIFYAFGNKAITNKLIIISAKNAVLKDFSQYDSNPTKRKELPFESLVNIVKATKAKFADRSVDSLIAGLFDFVDVDTKEQFVNLIKNVMRV